MFFHRLTHRPPRDFYTFCPENIGINRDVLHRNFEFSQNIYCTRASFSTRLIGDHVDVRRVKIEEILVFFRSFMYSIFRRASLDTLSFVAELDISNLAIEGNYDVDGRIILLQIRGSGPMTGDFTNCKALVKMQMQMSKGNDGENYLKLADLKTRISVGGGKLKLQNLFGGDPVLGEAVNTAINSNFDSFLKEIKPSIESAISNTFTDIANSILQQFTYEMLFPES